MIVPPAARRGEKAEGRRQSAEVLSAIEGRIPVTIQQIAKQVGPNTRTSGMSNRSYLAASEADSIYPSFSQEDYDAEQQLVASDVEALPLLWLALFRESDLRRMVFNLQGQEIPAFAPVCTKDQALQQLDQAVPYLTKIFPEFSRLAEYASLFRSAIEPLPYRFISIELEEIAALYPEEHRFEELLTLGLRGFDRPDDIRFHCDDVTLDFSGVQISIEPLDGGEADEELTEEFEELNAGGDPADEEQAVAEEAIIEGFTATSHAEVLERLTTLKPQVGLPSVRMYLDDLEHSDDEAWNFTRVLGAGLHGSMGYGREVPWEKEDADFGWEFTSADDDDE